MTGPPIRILREGRITTTPRAGEIESRISITYTVGPRSPQVLIVPESELPDNVWRIENPGEGAVPQAVQDAGDAKRRQLIEADLAVRGDPTPRTI